MRLVRYLYWVSEWFRNLRRAGLTFWHMLRAKQVNLNHCLKSLQHTSFTQYEVKGSIKVLLAITYKKSRFKSWNIFATKTALIFSRLSSWKLLYSLIKLTNHSEFRTLEIQWFRECWMAILNDSLHRKNGEKITMEFSRRKSKHVLRKVKKTSYPNHCTVLFCLWRWQQKCRIIFIVISNTSIIKFAGVSK